MASRGAGRDEWKRRTGVEATRARQAPRLTSSHLFAAVTIGPTEYVPVPDIATRGRALPRGRHRASLSGERTKARRGGNRVIEGAAAEARPW